MQYLISSVSNASISVRDMTFISVKKDVGDGRLVIAEDENSNLQYFYIGSDDEVIQLADVSITDTYNGIPISLLRPFWSDVIIEAANLI